ncbi:MAG: helix-turn-helix domain-containing protein [Phycisphaerae bacterium]
MLPVAPDQYADQTLYRSPIMIIGRFVCGPANDLWQRENVIRDGPLLAFGRHAVRIGIGDEILLGTPNDVMLYDDGQVYRRYAINGAGDDATWFHVSPAILRDALRTYDPAAADRSNVVVPFHRVDSDARVHLAQRTLLEFALAPQPTEPMLIEQIFLGLLNRVLSAGFRHRARMCESARNVATRAHHDQIVDAATIWMCTHACETVSIAAVADHVGMSMFHLCRVYRSVRGETLYRTLVRLRLRLTLEWVLAAKIDLTEAALRSGFCSSSHFSNAFRREFGIPPRDVRRIDAARLLSRIRTILQAA